MNVLRKQLQNPKDRQTMAGIYDAKWPIREMDYPQKHSKAGANPYFLTRTYGSETAAYPHSSMAIPLFSTRTGTRDSNGVKIIKTQQPYAPVRGRTRTEPLLSALCMQSIGC